jgi:hypothetical protein
MQLLRDPEEAGRLFARYDFNPALPKSEDIDDTTQDLLTSILFDDFAGVWRLPGDRELWR